MGSFAAKNYGLYDMAGNIWEWCNDWYDWRYYDSSPTSNPTGPAGGAYRVVRGGSWLYNAYFCRVAIQVFFRPDSRSRRSGFRIVLDF